jgi:hypothetical protein
MLLVPVSARGQGFVATMIAANSADSAGRHLDAARLYQQAYRLSGFDPTGLAIAAESATQGGDAELAFSLLDRAVAGGVLEPRLFADSAFVALHRDPRWARLQADVARRTARLDLPLRTELLQLADRDQRNRQGLAAIMQRYGSRSSQGDSALKALTAADAPIQARLRQIIVQHGWPVRTMVADDGAHAAWLVLQHMPLADQSAQLPRVLAAVKSNNARAGDGALLEDRVLVGTHHPQRYGTQMASSSHGGPPTVDSIENEACVDARRKTVGLEPLAEYLKGFGVTYVVKGRCAQ